MYQYCYPVKGWDMHVVHFNGSMWVEYTRELPLVDGSYYRKKLNVSIMCSTLKRCGNMFSLTFDKPKALVIISLYTFARSSEQKSISISGDRFRQELTNLLLNI